MMRRRLQLAARKLWPGTGSLRSQLMARSLLLLTILLIGVGCFQYLFMERFLYQNKADAVQRQIRAVPGEMWQRLAEGTRRGRENPPFFGLPSATVLYRDRTGTVFQLAPDPDGAAAPVLGADAYNAALHAPREGRRKSYWIAKDGSGTEQLVILQNVRSFAGTGGVIQVSMDTGPLKADLYRQLALYGGIAFIALLLGWLLFVPVIRRTLVPLSNVTAMMEKIDSGNLDERLPSGQGQAEIDHLASSVNRMLERLEQAFHSEREAKERMRRFVADASHELRTPLTSIHGFLEVLLRGAAAHPEQLERSLRSMYGESQRLGKLVQDLLLLAKLDHRPKLNTIPADLDGIVREMEPQLRMLAQDREVRMEWGRPPSLPLDRDKIKQVILNLFHNAVQHTDPMQGRIVVSTAFADNKASLTVTDNGSGIAAAQLPLIFDRFYRLDESRARIHGGTGLGLSISRSIVELHGGTIEAESTVGQGSSFRVVLPVLAPDAETLPS